MANVDPIGIISWSVITAICVVIIGLVYKKVTNKNESHPS